MASSYSSSHFEDPNDSQPLPHPYLREPKLFISGLAPNVRKEDLGEVLRFCTPYRPNLPLDEQGRALPGFIEFRELASAERALATLQNRPLPGFAPACNIVLSPFAPTTPPTTLPPPAALPRLVKQLPIGVTDSYLYDLFRPFGPLANVRSEAGFGPDIGVVEFWREEDARRAEEAMHCAEVGDQNISIQVYQPRRAPGAHTDFSASAPPFVPASAMYQQQQQQQTGAPQNYSPPGGSSPYNRSPPQSNAAFMHGPGQQVQYAPPYGPGSQSHSGLIDPCNLFIKNLDLNIDSNELFTHFRTFGSIVSARVMRTETGQSRGFGFVSYQSPDQASSALAAMNGTTLGSKPIIVRLHEPKQLRQEKLATRYSAGGRTRSPHPRSASGATSPSPSEMGEMHSPLDRVRRSSGSYYQAALAGTLGLPIRYEELSALSPVVRKEVLVGELSRKLKTMDEVAPTDVESLADTIAALSLVEVIECIQNTESLTEQVRKVQGPVQASPERQPSLTIEIAPSDSPPSQSLNSAEPGSLSSTPAPPASNPEHPSTPLSVAASLSGPPRTSSPSGSLAVGSEKDRLLASVSRIDPANAADITDLLLSLPKKERAMCLFNVEFLKGKIADAKAVLEADDDTEATASVSTVPAITPATPSKGNGAILSSIMSPQTPDLSSTGPSTAASPEVPGTPLPPATVHTLASLARLPAVEILRMASSPSSTGLPLPKADPVVWKATDEFIDSLNGQSEQQKKQQVGTKLFKVVKAFGVRNAKVTIHLLDTEDLRSLAHLMNSYPSLLKEKVLQATAATSK